MRMMVCSRCQAENKLSGRYCAQCGTEFAENERLAARAENDKLVSDGKRLLTDGRTEEAGMIAKTVLDIDPDSVSALMLFGDVSERMGQYAEAAEAYELVLKLKPDSPLERIRLAHLQKLSAQQEIAVIEPQNKRQTFWAAAAAAFLLVCVGSALLLATQPAPGKDIAKSNVAPDEIVNAFNVPPPVPTGPVRPFGEPAVATTAPPQVESTNTGVQTQFRKPFNGSSGIAETDGTLAPMNVGPVGNTTTPATATNSTPAPAESGSKTGAPPGNQTDPTATPAKNPAQNPPGVIDIKPSAGQSSAVPTGEDAETLIRSARDLYAQASYAKAAEVYQRALKAGASPGSTNQRLAQCYEKLGRTKEAIASYTRAITAYEQQIKNARTDRAIEACRKAIQVLGG